jgi:hypothetical protein
VKWGLNEECENIGQLRAVNAALGWMSEATSVVGTLPSIYSSTVDAPMFFLLVFEWWGCNSSIKFGENCLLTLLSILLVCSLHRS